MARSTVVWLAIAGTLLLAGGVFVGMNCAQDNRMQDAAGQSPFPHRVRMGPFPEELEWVNVEKPLELNDLRGKFVLLDFWTYCCINCMHVLPELKKLEKAYPDELVVIGVHSAKFEGERDTKNIREAVARYEIEHPVVNDPQLVLWRRLGVRAWPTLVLIDPEGYAVWGNSGETTFEKVEKVLKPAIAFYDRKGLLDRTPLSLRVTKKQAETALRFPGKVLADEASDRLFISDSNHNRIVVARLDGTLLNMIGSGAIGAADGDFAAAEFNHPQGMALHGDSLLVADTENHLIRKVDLQKQQVSTIAGTGEQSRDLPPLGRAAPARKTALSSPWDLWIHDDELYIAMAGAHQIWRMPLDSARIEVYAGNGREDIVDGPLVPHRVYQPGFSSFAQPSGLTSDGTWFYVADSEGSSIRAVPFDRRSEVRTVVGTADLAQARLFTFGDVDGAPPNVRLQHPLAVAFHQGKLYVADTYNDKLKVIDPKSGATQTLVVDAGDGAGEANRPFDEPAGLSVAAGKLYVADTNNHRIAVVDLGHGNRLSTLKINGLKPVATPATAKQP